MEERSTTSMKKKIELKCENSTSRCGVVIFGNCIFEISSFFFWRLILKRVSSTVCINANGMCVCVCVMPYSGALQRNKVSFSQRSSYAIQSACVARRARNLFYIFTLRNGTKWKIHFSQSHNASLTHSSSTSLSILS